MIEFVQNGDGTLTAYKDGRPIGQVETSGTPFVDQAAHGAHEAPAGAQGRPEGKRGV